MNKYAYKYTYICICDSLIIGKFGSLLQFGKIGCFTRFVAHPVTKIMFHSLDRTRQLNCNFHYEYTTVKLVLSCLFQYKKTLVTSPHYTSLLICVIDFNLSFGTSLLILSTSTCTSVYYFRKLIFTHISPSKLNLTLTSFILLLTQGRINHLLSFYMTQTAQEMAHITILLLLGICWCGSVYSRAA
jgi:hypothetical protein